MNLDPENVNSRLYHQVSELLRQLEENNAEITIPQRINALIAIGRIQTIFLNLRLKDKPDESAAGATVRKYAGAFEAHDARRRKATARAAAAAAEDDGDDIFADDDEADSA